MDTVLGFMRANAAPRRRWRGDGGKPPFDKERRRASRGGFDLGCARSRGRKASWESTAEAAIPRRRAPQVRRNLELGAFARVIGLVSRGGRTAERAKKMSDSSLMPSAESYEEARWSRVLTQQAVAFSAFGATLILTRLWTSFTS